MKRLLTILLTAVIATTASAAKKQAPAHGYPINPVPFTSVKVTPSTFWGQRLEASRKVTIPLAFSKCEETGRYTNFSNAAQHLKDPSKVFKVGGLAFDDTDPYKPRAHRTPKSPTSGRARSAGAWKRTSAMSSTTSVTW